MAEVESAIASLWQRFSGAIFERIDMLESAAKALRDGTLTPELRAQAEQVSHKLAGSLGTFGFPRGSKIASELELLFRSAATSPVEASDRAIELVCEMRGVLKPPSAP
jgi:HPt (histidine-containing phosphotransfer) domain-containing protein